MNLYLLLSSSARRLVDGFHIFKNLLVEQDFVLETEFDDRVTRQIYTRQTTHRPRLSSVSHPLEFPVLDNIVSQLPVSYASTDQALRRAQDQNHLYIGGRGKKISIIIYGKTSNAIRQWWIHDTYKFWERNCCWRANFLSVSMNEGRK